MRRASGFSLIEIAIVLAVISLIAAAVLMGGGSLFGRSGMTTLLSHVKDLSTASREFKVRYGYFPGDLLKAGDFISGASCNGNGNGIVDTEPESNCALEHLVKAGMLRGIDYDAAAGHYVIAINNWGTGTRVSLSHDPDTRTNAVRVSNLPCDVALEIDRRLDSATSGNTPFTEGSVRARDASNAPIPTCVPDSTVATLLIRY